MAEAPSHVNASSGLPRGWIPRRPPRVGAQSSTVQAERVRHPDPLCQALLLSEPVNENAHLAIFSPNHSNSTLIPYDRELVYDLYTYLWDMCGVVQTLEGFVQWMSKGACSPKSQHYVVGQQTWFSGMREAFLSGDHEPWMFRGGLVSDLQRLLPLDSGNDLYHYKFPDVPAPLLYYVRPFQPRDEDAVYALAADAYERSIIAAPMGLCAADRDLIGDKDVGAYLTLCPEYSFVCESSLDGSIVGFACAAPDARYTSRLSPTLDFPHCLNICFQFS